jgi:hypothetical protein
MYQQMLNYKKRDKEKRKGGLEPLKVERLLLIIHSIQFVVRGNLLPTLFKSQSLRHFRLFL